jgi:hypothetical protein
MAAETCGGGELFDSWKWPGTRISPRNILSDLLPPARPPEVSRTSQNSIASWDLSVKT